MSQYTYDTESFVYPADVGFMGVPTAKQIMCIASNVGKAAEICRALNGASDKERKIKRLQSTLDQMDKRLIAAHADHDKTVARSSGLEHEIKRLQSALDQTRERVIEARTERDNALAHAQEFKAANKTLREKLDTQERLIESLRLANKTLSETPPVKMGVTVEEFLGGNVNTPIKNPFTTDARPPMATQYYVDESVRGLWETAVGAAEKSQKALGQLNEVQEYLSKLHEWDRMVTGDELSATPVPPWHA